MTKFRPFSKAQLRYSLVSELRQWLASEIQGTKLRQINFEKHLGLGQLSKMWYQPCGRFWYIVTFSRWLSEERSWCQLCISFESQTSSSYQKSKKQCIGKLERDILFSFCFFSQWMIYFPFLYFSCFVFSLVTFYDPRQQWLL